MSVNVDNKTVISGKVPARARGRVRAGVLRLGFWGLVLGLVALNLWLAWEARPLPDLPAISRLMDKELYSEAERALRAHVRRSPHHGEARMMLARVLTAQNDLAGAADQLHQVPFWWPSKPEALFREGQVQMALGRARRAEEAWKACVANDPLHPTPPRFFTSAARELIVLYEWEERRDEAHELIWRVYQQVEKKDHAAILIMSAWVELLRNDPAEEASKLSRFVAADADDWDARVALAKAEMARGNTAEATRQIQICLAARPQDLRGWRNWLLILSKGGDQAGLAAALKQLPEGADADAEIWTIRGLACERAGDWQGAADAYRQAVRLRPWADEAYYKLAIVEERLGEPTAAAADRQRQQALRGAREQLRQAYDAYVDATQSPQLARMDLGPIYERLAMTCAAAGLERDAEAWRRLSTRP
jgi:tetratricopeptide (TPR) repeat protein